jgi:hypothetical protein
LRKSHAAKFRVGHAAHQSAALTSQREQRYRRVLRQLRRPIRYYDIRLTGKMVRGLLKRVYLWPDERDDLNALRQALILFMSDTLRKTPKPKRPDGPGPSVSAYAGDEAIDD